LADDRKPTPDKEAQEGTAEQSLFGRVTRRSFLSHLGAAGIAATASPVLAATATQEPAPADAAAEAPAAAGTVPLTLRVNGKSRVLRLDPRTTLLDCLRENLNLPGTKKGCDHGQCGACTVHVNGQRVNSCLSFAVMHSGDEITTIEGIGQPEHLHPMQAAFVEHDGYQCGYCTSGQIMSGVALLGEPVGPSDEDVKQAMYGNICRCGAYPNIVAAVQTVRRNA
jgi:xanthine dehydrogenase YagT iron-sulfur-binding subunit